MRIETFFENFELLTDAPNAIARLREIILQLAFQGKLTEQLDEAPTAIELLKEIQKKEQEKTVKQRVKKNSLDLDPLNCKGIFEVPDSWKWAYLDFLCDQIGDIDHKMPKAVEKGVPFLSAKDLKDDGILDFSNPKYISEEDYERLSRKIKPQKDDIIYSRIGAKLGKARLVEVDKKFLISYSCCLVRPKHKYINLHFLQHFLDSRLALDQAKLGTQSIGVPDLGLNVIKQYCIPFPPLAEQKQIVEKCDRLMSLCDQIEVRQQKRQESIVRMNESAIAQLLSSHNPDEFSQHWQRICNNFDLLYSIPETIPKLRQAILQLAVQGKLVRQDHNDEPASSLLQKIDNEQGTLIIDEVSKKEEHFNIPASWRWVYLERISAKIHYGYTASANHELLNVRLLRITDIQDNRVTWESIPGCEITRDDFEKFKLRNGDLLIARTGGTIGKSFLVELISLNSVFASYLIRVVPCSQVFARYIKIFLDSPLYWKQLHAKSMGTGQPNVNATSLKSLIVPLPPLAEQKRIVVKCDRLMSLCDLLEAKLKEARSHSETLMEVAAKQVLAG